MRDFFQRIAHVVFVSIDHSGFLKDCSRGLCLRRFSRTAHEVLSPVIMMDFQGLLMRFNRVGFSRTPHEVISMSRDEFPNAPCSRDLRFAVSSHLVLFFSASVHTVVKIWSDVSILFSARSFPLEREEVQTLRSAISSRTRAVDGLSWILAEPHSWSIA